MSKEKYKEKSWCKIKDEKSDYKFYKSTHKLKAKQNFFYHFIINPFN